MEKHFNLIESKGDVHFYEDQKGNQYQQLGVANIYPVKDGKISYRYISTVNGIKIQYQNNGCNGFSLFKGNKILEDNIWVYADAERIAKTI